MSVLNQVLRDLENRGLSAEAQEAADAASSAAAPFVRPPMPMRPAQPPTPQGLRIAVWGGVALIVVGTIVSYAVYARHLKSSIVAPKPLGIEQFVALAQPAPDAAAPASPSTSAIESAPAGPQTEAATRPVADTAAQDLPGEPPIDPKAIAPLAALRPSTSPAFAAAVATASVSDAEKPTAKRSESKPPVAARPRPAVPAAVPATPPSAIGATPTVAAEPAAIVSRPSHPGAALEARAAELIGRGRASEAMALLQQVLENNPGNGNTRAMLAALQAESGRRDLALHTLLAGSQMEPERFAASAAQLQADLGDAAAALATLDRVPAAARNAQHEALVAGIAQRAGQHRRAVEAFQQAVRAPGAPATWWAGLAVSLEALDQPSPALDAFRRAAADPALPPSIRTYVLNRIGALAAHNGGVATAQQ